MISSYMIYYQAAVYFRISHPLYNFLIDWDRVNITGNHYSHHKYLKLQTPYLNKIEYNRYYSSLNEMKLWFLEL